MRKILPAALLPLLVTAGATAQLDQTWVQFAPNPARLDMAPTALTSATTEASFAVGDLDLDGWADVVAAREEPASPGGKRTDMLLMNDHGVLRDRTAQFAALSDVPGDTGFLKPSGDRDAELGDVDGDGWPDVILARTLHEGEPKSTSHPRIYRNLGDAAGAWQGLEHEDARIPQMVTAGGLAVAPRFVAVSVGDIDNDGDLDLHFVDQDGVGVGEGPELPGHDLNDRLLVNDGLGYFTDESFVRMTSKQLESLYGIDTRIVDMNGDGAAEITHLTSDGTPTGLFTEYNEPADLGHFQALSQQASIGTTSPYAFDIGELNNDGRPDIAIEDDASGRFRLNQGIDVLGRVIWGPLKIYQYAGGSDDGFGGNVHMHDLDGDGWNDVLICDMDIDVVDCGKRLHIFHNLGGAPGSDVNLREEAELASGNQGPGWKGVVGMSALDLKGTYDVALGDFDNDGDDDMLVARCTGSFFWENQANPSTLHCQADLGHAGPGGMQLAICGQELGFEGAQATLSLTGAVPGQPLFLPLGLDNAPTPFKGGTLVPFPPLTIVVGLVTDAGGGLSLPVTGFGGSPVTVYLQAIVKNGPVTEFSNAVELVIGL